MSSIPFIESPSCPSAPTRPACFLLLPRCQCYFPSSSFLLSFPFSLSNRSIIFQLLFVLVGRTGQDRTGKDWTGQDRTIFGTIPVSTYLYIRSNTLSILATSTVLGYLINMPVPLAAKGTYPIYTWIASRRCIIVHISLRFPFTARLFVFRSCTTTCHKNMSVTFLADLVGRRTKVWNRGT